MGPKLQALINGNCISSQRAEELGPTQKAAIEDLTQTQIEVLIQVQAAVGAVPNGQMI